MSYKKSLSLSRELATFLGYSFEDLEHFGTHSFKRTSVQNFLSSNPSDTEIRRFTRLDPKTIPTYDNALSDSTIALGAARAEKGSHFSLQNAQDELLKEQKEFEPAKSLNSKPPQDDLLKEEKEFEPPKSFNSKPPGESKTSVKSTSKSLVKFTSSLKSPTPRRKRKLVKKKFLIQRSSRKIKRLPVSTVNEFQVVLESQTNSAEKMKNILQEMDKNSAHIKNLKEELEQYQLKQIVFEKTLASYIDSSFEQLSKYSKVLGKRKEISFEEVSTEYSDDDESDSDISEQSFRSGPSL